MTSGIDCTVLLLWLLSSGRQEEALVGGPGRYTATIIRLVMSSSSSSLSWVNGNGHGRAENGKDEEAESVERERFGWGLGEPRIMPCSVLLPFVRDGEGRRREQAKAG